MRTKPTRCFHPVRFLKRVTVPSTCPFWIARIGSSVAYSTDFVHCSTAGRLSTSSWKWALSISGICLIGTTRETVTTQLNRFRRMKLVSRQGRNIIVHWRRLEDYAATADARRPRP